ncbi:MAG: membrane protein insertion efficiency factor YidD [bacterium]|nr:membrane protein insertion efficiency factor YidD [bacterium]
MFKFYPRYIAVKILKVYQKTLSFDHGIFKVFYPHGFCRFHPTCSEYAIQSVEKYGFIKGGIKAVWRVLRCNPFNSGGFDPLK